MKMKILKLSRCWIAVACASLFFTTFQATPEDIDIFSVDDSSTVNNPNVLIVLDNTSNWSRQSQQWPGGEQQGQSEVDAIKRVMNELDATINVGLMEFVTGGNANDDGGFVRYHIRPMNASNKTVFGGKLDTIYGAITNPAEKRNSGTAYGNLIYDVHNYLAGAAVFNSGAGTPSSLADSAGYSTSFTNFRSPLTAANTCGRTILIFISNPDSSGPTGDGSANVSALQALGGSTSQINFENYTTQTTAVITPTGYTSACYTNNSACTSAENGAACTGAGYTSCECSSTDFLACPASHFSVVGSNTATSSTVVSDTTASTADQYTGEATTCRSSTPPGTLTCPATSTSSSTSGNRTTTITTSWSGCAWANTGVGCGGPKTTWEPHGTSTQRTVVSDTTSTTTQTTLGETAACYNDVASCTTTGFNCSGFNNGCSCAAAGSTTGCGAGTTNRYQVMGTFNRTTVTPTGTFSVPPTQAGNNFMIDEWARYLRQVGVTIPGTGVKTQVSTYTIDVFNAQQNATHTALMQNTARVGGGKYFAARNKNSLVDALRQIFTEVQAVNSAFSSASLPVNATNRAQNENQVFIGVFKPDRTKDPLWFGNMKRYQLVSSNGTIRLGDANGVSAINSQTGFFSDCATSFWTSDSGPYWTTVGTDDPEALGICSSNSTSDSSDLPDGPFVEKGAVAEVLRKGNNPGTAPDVNGNFALNRTVYTRTSGSLATFNSTTFDDGDAGTDDAAENVVVRFIRGEDVDNDDSDSPANTSEPRSTIHGDVVHSRPQPVNYGGTTGVVVFYGANDGTYRAVKANTGQELWSFVAPEHFSKLTRLRRNDPIVKFYGDSSLSAAPKDYFFDGSTGLLQNADNSRVFIYPTMRRGGRGVYALNVTNPASPQMLWSKGCPSTTSDSGCDTGFTGLGETWSIPNAAYIKGYSDTRPVVIMGGGYDRCEEANTAAPACGTAKGKGVYVLDAETGAIVKFFDFTTLSGFTARSVAADTALIDVDNDGKVDYVYAADTGGNIYRLSFIDAPSTLVPLASSDWTMQRIAFTDGDGRKFLFPPALLQANNRTVYLAIGSGDREHPLMSQYPFSSVTNRFYVFKDNLSAVGTTVDLDDTDFLTDNTSSTSCDSPQVLPSSEETGWFMSLNQNGPGEQVVTSAVIAGGFVIFSTNQPTPPDPNSCSNSLGEARGYFVNLLNASGAIGTARTCGGGQRSSSFIGGGLPPSPVLATVPINGELRTVVIGAVQRETANSANSAIEAQRVRPSISSTRRPIYWEKPVDAR